ncbi:tetratricopeptide repeat protein [Flavihumibacter rivuli]|uniref:type IX secretion system periplasmic lipoprotein PorW/SprE n=1 Tax=Flavihumibacter rivuli TaxID=2838156 RepID=UPI001BDE3D01|nr:tetratricopeptide repeat protein [Flavihumibacter rivuli]ULQ57042.1 tetratricopeptide repeat protein [Flavihumibacter rivuli]
MNLPHSHKFTLILLSCLFFQLMAKGQPTLDPDLKKPKKFENRVLGAEKTATTKFKLPRRFIQNTVTHYNYYFNAQTKIDQVLEAVKAQHTDRYASLLPFYNYTLEQTAEARVELDSVIYKVTAGVLLHDLRSDWMDNLYLLLGQAYFYKNQLDSAYISFQYMNYAFSPKEEDGYDKVIASNANEGGSNMVVSTVEKRNIIKRTFSMPPNRNEALVWLIRTFLAGNNLGAASTMIQTLRNDPEFPERLQPQLAEVTANYFYLQEQYDSAAFYLEKALPVAQTKGERARWEYLLGQLYDRAGKPEAARNAFLECIKHTMNPVMEVAARLQASQQIRGPEDVNWKEAVEELKKMAKKERYTAYRDLIYYTIARIEINQKLYPDAEASLQKSVKYSMNNPEQKSTSYQLLGDVAMQNHHYVAASTYYDSVDVTLMAETEAMDFEKKRELLSRIAAQYRIIERQDSLQRLAALPEDERKAIIKKQLRVLRRQRGLKEEETTVTPQGAGMFTSLTANTPSDLFSTYDKGEWYFYNTSMKARGFTEFRTKWGNRPNVDNWRRAASISNATFQKETPSTEALQQEPTPVDELSMEGLESKIPLTPEQMQVSNDSILMAQFQLGLALQDGMEDYDLAIQTYEGLLARFPANNREAEVLYNLHFCYKQLGRNADAARVMELMNKSYPGTRFQQMAQDPVAVQKADSAQVEAATKTYTEIYNQYIEGDFTNAIGNKQKADSLYGDHYWTPQLLYIEAIYQVKTGADTIAIETLTQLRNKFPDHPLALKAETLIDVIGRRKEIEDYLRNLQIERPAEDTPVILDEEPVAKADPKAANIKKAEGQKPAEAVKVGPEKLANKKEEPQVYIPEAEIKAAKKVEVARAKPVGIDSSKLKKEAPVLAPKSPYTRFANQPHQVILVLDKVDPVYVNEARNAFDRYNRENYYNQKLPAAVASLTDTIKLVTITGFANEQAAIDYIEKANPLTTKEIIPWLKKDKYVLLPVAEVNLTLLMNSKDLKAYKEFLEQVFPNRFK